MNIKILTIFPLIVLLVLLLLCPVYAEQKNIVIDSITLSNYEIEESKDVCVYVTLKNSYSKELVIEDAYLYNNNITFDKSYIKIKLAPNSQDVLTIKFKANNESVSYLKLKLSYSVENVKYAEVKDSQQFKIVKSKSFLLDLKDILQPILISIVISFLTNFTIWFQQKRSKNLADGKFIKSKLYFQSKILANELLNLDVTKNITCDLLNDIVCSELYLFFRENMPRQLTEIEDFMKKISKYNAETKDRDRLNLSKEINTEFRNIVNLINNLYMERGFCFFIKEHIKSNRRTSTNNSNLGNSANV